MVDRVTPLRRQRLSGILARQIISLIRAGRYRHGDTLPSIAEIARQSAVSPPTVREALVMLETLGLLEIRPGAGIYVSADGATRRG